MLAFVRATNVEDREYFRPPYHGTRAFFLSVPWESFSLTAFPCGFYGCYEDAPTRVAGHWRNHRLHRPDRGPPHQGPFCMPHRFPQACLRTPRGSRDARRFQSSTAGSTREWTSVPERNSETKFAIL